MAADEKYPVLNRDNLTIPIETQLYEKQKNFFELAAAFLRSRLNFKCFKKKYAGHIFCIFKVTDSENVVR